MQGSTLNITTLTVSAFGQNCRIIEHDGYCLICDPGGDAPVIAKAILDRNLTPVAIILTHGHIDHVQAAGTLAKMFDKLPILGPMSDDAFLIDSIADQASWFGLKSDFEPVNPIYFDKWQRPLTVDGISLDFKLKAGSDGSLISLGELCVKTQAPINESQDASELFLIEVVNLAGHTPGGVAYYFKEAQFCLCGDSIFEGSIGRTDLPRGDYDSLIAALKDKLLKLPDPTKLLCGHGPDTTVLTEKRYNPFLQ